MEEGKDSIHLSDKVQPRWLNWRDFVEGEKLVQKRHDILILIVHYNSVQSLEKIYRKIDSEAVAADILILDNHSSQVNLEQLSTDQPLASVVRTNENLGGAGGYAMALEWGLSRGYDFFFVIEDDIEVISPHFFSTMISEKKSARIVRATYQDFQVPSYTFHASIYPRAFIENAGIPRADYFMRGDDFEWGWRVIRANGGLFKVFYDLDSCEYRHPIFKQFNSVFFRYLHIRNSLDSFSRLGFFKEWIMLILRSVFVATSFGLMDGRWIVFRMTFTAYRDYLVGSFENIQNQRLKKEYLSISETSQMEQSKIDISFQDLFPSGDRFSRIAFFKLFSSIENLKRIAKRGDPIVLSYLNDLHFLLKFSKHVLVLNHVNTESEIFNFFKINQSQSLRNWGTVLPVLILSTLLSVLAILLAAPRYFLIRFKVF